MARPVTVSAVSAYPMALDPAMSDDELLAVIVANWSARIAAVLPDRPDIVVLPEHCDRPYAELDPVVHFPIPRIAEFTRYKGDRIRDVLADIARTHDTRIAYSGYRLDEAGELRNSTQLIGVDGDVCAVYDKNYLTIAEHEQRGVAYGARIPVFETDIGRVAMTICFDLNFDEGLRELAAQRPELILFSSAYHGGLMQRYWAYTAQSYFVGAVLPPNTSDVLNPVGERIAASTNYRFDVTTTVNLDYAVVHIDLNMPALRRAKRDLGPAIRIHDPGQVGVLLLTVESPDLTIDTVLRDYGIERATDYLDRSAARRRRALRECR